MTDYTTKRFDLLLLVYGAMSALVVTLPTLIFGNDIDTFLLSVVIAALVSLVLLIVAIRKSEIAKSRHRIYAARLLRNIMGTF